MPLDMPLLDAWWSPRPRDRQTTSCVLPCGQIIGSVSGSLIVSAAVEWLVVAGQAIWLPAGTVHDVLSCGPVQDYGVQVHAAHGMRLPETPYLVGTTPLLLATIERLSATAGTGESTLGRHHRLQSVCWDEWTALGNGQQTLPMPRNRRLRRVCAALLANPADPRRRDQWAGIAAMSTSSFLRHLVDETGLDFASWRHAARMLVARERLAQGMPVSQVAHGVGYQSVSAFSRAFTRHTRMAPRAYAKAGLPQVPMAQGAAPGR